MHRVLCSQISGITPLLAALTDDELLASTVVKNEATANVGLSDGQIQKLMEHFYVCTT